MKDSAFVKIGGLWKGKDKNGHAYLSGRLDKRLDPSLVEAGGKVFVSRNKYKERGDKLPDYNLYLLLDAAPPAADDTGF